MPVRSVRERRVIEAYVCLDADPAPANYQESRAIRLGEERAPLSRKSADFFRSPGRSYDQDRLPPPNNQESCERLGLDRSRTLRRARRQQPTAPDRFTSGSVDTLTASPTANIHLSSHFAGAQLPSHLGMLRAWVCASLQAPVLRGRRTVSEHGFVGVYEHRAPHDGPRVVKMGLKSYGAGAAAHRHLRIIRAPPGLNVQPESVLLDLCLQAQ